MATDQAKPETPTLADQLAKDPAGIIMAMLWCNRHRIQDMTMVLPLEQLDRFHAALRYNEQNPILHVQASRRAIVVYMQDAAGNQIIQSESTEADQADKERAAAIHRAAGSAEQLIADHRAMAARGETSDSLTQELYDSLAMLARAARQ